MYGQLKTNTVNLELIVSWLRQEQDQIGEILRDIEHTKNYHDAYVNDAVRSLEMNFKQIRRFIESN